MDAHYRTCEWLELQGLNPYYADKPKRWCWHRWQSRTLSDYTARVCSKCNGVQVWCAGLAESDPARWLWSNWAYHDAYVARYPVELAQPSLVFRNGETQLVYPELVVEHCKVYDVSKEIV